MASAMMERAERFAAETQARKRVLKTVRDNAAKRLHERVDEQRDEASHHYSRDV